MTAARSPGGARWPASGLEQPDASIDTIRDVLNSFPAFARSGDVLHGCLITNAATELAPTPDTSQQAMGRYIDRLGNAFANALQNSTAGVPDVTAMARSLTATMLGMFVMIRARTDAHLLQDAVDSALDHIESQLA